jgi:CheY-like chemotaxis protein/anti-sigma regulatory factor (Ser/Thr protein kinase)
MTDRGKLKQVLFNLLSNAAKFTKEGSVRVAVEADDERVRIHVRDTGIGIPPDALGALFQEFQQVDATTTREYGGTGLGLAICRKIAHLLKGEVSVESELGKGSTFSIELPRSFREGPTIDRTDPTASRPPFDRKSPSAGPLLLVVDDDPHTIDLLRQDLSEAGYRVAEASNGQEGVERARELSPDAIVLDVMMSTKDGWQVLHELKTDDATREIPVIMLSVVDQRPLGYRLGASDYLLKPIHREALLDAVRRVASRGRLLVIDDDENVHDLIGQILEDQPVEVHFARDGQDGLRLMREMKPDAVFLDLMMPVLDGFGVLRAVRDDETLCRIPIVVLTAKSLSSDELSFLGDRTQRVLQKRGLDRQSLLTEVRKALPRAAEAT